LFWRVEGGAFQKSRDLHPACEAEARLVLAQLPRSRLFGRRSTAQQPESTPATTPSASGNNGSSCSQEGQGTVLAAIT
jgi:hypothetical protein